MNIEKKILIALGLFLLTGYLKAQNFGGNPAAIKWKQFDNATTRVIFPLGLDSQARRINAINQLLEKNTAYSIGGKQQKWAILLLNQTTISNGIARMAPILSEFYMTPNQDNFSSGSLRWDDNLIIHENRHIQQYSNFKSGLTKVFSFFLGQEGQLLANGMAIPDYFFEGDAVWQETLVSSQGRGRLPSFFNGTKALSIENKKYSWMKLRSGSYRDYTPDHYELGYQLVAYGYEKYGEEFWRKVTQDAVQFKGIFFSYEKAIEKYTGISYQQFRENAMKLFAEKAFPSSPNDPLADHYFTASKKHQVVDYLFPNYISDDTLLVTKKSNQLISGFYWIVKGEEKKIQSKKIVIDDYYSYKNGMVVYASYQSDLRWGNSNYSNIQLLNIYTNQERQISFKTKYFSPDINESGSEILAVTFNPNGTNYLHRINTNTGELIKEIPNTENYFYTQPKYIDSNTAISAVRNSAGEMSLVKVNLTNGANEIITPFSLNVIGYPFIKGDTVYFSAMNNNTDKIFAVSLLNKKIFQLTNNINGVYQPSINNKNELLFTAFSAEGSRLVKMALTSSNWNEINPKEFTQPASLYNISSLQAKGADLLKAAIPNSDTITTYKKSLHLFNFHSWRPELADPEYGYNLYSDNVLSSFSNTLKYTFNRSDRSHTLGFNEVFAGWFPLLQLGSSYSFNRNIDTAVGKTVNFNSAKINAGVYIPLNFVGGNSSTQINFGGGYNIEQLFYGENGKNVLNNLSVKYANFLISVSNFGRQAKQHINPHWGQTIAVTYRNAFKLINTNKLVANGSLYFPGLFTNHSFVLNGSYQSRDTSFNYFSNTFSYSRGYEALSTREMYKWGANYHFPIVYPDWGFSNLLFIQRIRANAFYDHTTARARLNRVLTKIKNRSVGAEIYFDSKAWNALPVSFGFRYTHLIDTDLINPGTSNRWEFIVPIGLIPN